MAKKIKFTKNTFKKIGAVLLAGALGIGAIFGIAKLGEVLDTETKIIHPTYSVGGLKTTDGKYTETTDSIYTKEAFECQGLKITPDFDSNVSYEVFFYDSNEQFLSSSGSKTDFYESDNILAKYARIQITPLEDDKVSWYETAKYGAQLKVEVNKDQIFNIEKAFKKLDNQFKPLGEGIYNNAGTIGFAPGSSGCYFFDFINVANVDTLILKVKASTLDNVISLGNGESFNLPHLYRLTSENKSQSLNFDYSILATVDDFVYVSYDISNETNIFGFVDVNSFATLEIYVL